MGRRPWLRGVLRCGVLLAAVSLAVLPAGLASAAPVGGGSGAGGGTTATSGMAGLTQAEQTLLPILNRLHALYQQMETATQKYDAMSEQLTQAQTDVLELNVQVANAQARVDLGTETAGALAAQQYRDGSVSDLTRLLFAEDPQTLLHNKDLLEAAARSQADLLQQLSADQATLVNAQSAAVISRERVQELVAAQAKVKDGINKELTGVEQLVSNLTGAQRAELSQLEQQQASAAQLALLASGALGKDGAKPSAAGAAAVAYAFAQLGKPYVWGGDGPQVFDCSGLTSQAWLHAGQPIPRTSEEQWAQLTHIPLNQLRPGDLILYFTGASHVAIYIGGGLVIQAPHPGAFVDIAPIAQNPILGAVRPDPQGVPLGTYTPPTAPPGSSNPQPIGPTTPVQPPAPTPKPTPTPTPRPTGTPKPTPTGSPSPTGSPAETPTPTPTPSPSVTPSTTAAASATASVTASVTTKPSGSAAARQ